MADLNKEPVQAEPFNFTKYTSIGSTAAAAVVGAYTVIRQAVDDDVDPLVALGVFLALGLVAIAIAVVAAADVLARSYVASNTMVDPEDEDKLLPASAVLALAMEKQGAEQKIVSVPRIKGTKHGGQPVTLLAMRFTGDKTEFQVQKEGSGDPQWVEPSGVEFPQQKV
jgi:hypothetical protein